jgi:sulfur dioxygenase
MPTVSSAVLLRSLVLAISATYVVTVLLDVNDIQETDDRAEARSYIVADRESGQAIIIDSVLENVERDIRIIQDLALTLIGSVETHIHADHITGADRFLSDGETLWLGKTPLTAVATPGHTEGCTSYVLPGAVFTGDALFIRGNGRTDLQGGSAELLFDSVRQKLFALPDETIVYPGHDYHGRVFSTIGEEKRFNERLNLSIEKNTFVDMMNRRKTPPPAKMDVAIPANLRAGRLL